jgi:hypothetical protein
METITTIPIADIAVTMITVDRSLKGKRTNYLGETLRNLNRAGVFTSPRLRSFTICDSLGDPRLWCSEELVFAANRIEAINGAVGNAVGRFACENAGHALICGGLAGAKWVLFLEDDIDVCADFLGSVGRFLDKYGQGQRGERFRLFAFGAAYDQLKQQRQQGYDYWTYPVNAFYGTQAFALRAEDAVSLGRYISSNPMIRGVYNPNAYDLMFHDWAAVHHPGCEFLASAPSFVEHIGRESVCTGKEETHRFESWPGREWSYRPTEVVELAV